MREGLQITNPESIPFVDIHRLPQRPIFRKGIRVKRPIIDKLTKVADKRLIYSRLRNLKRYHKKHRSTKSGFSVVYITDHLPKKILEEKKLLMPQFIEAKRQNKKTAWIVRNGHYDVYVDNVKMAFPENRN